MTNEPTSTRPVHFPSEYGQRGTPEDQPLPWSYVEERLQKALNYWLTTVSPSGRPHVRPVDGVWVLGSLCFGGSDETRWVKNLEQIPAASINLGSEEEAIILEGEVEYITEPSNPLGAASTAASREKYPQYFKEGAPLDSQEFLPFWCFRPRVAYAWTLTGFPNRATRWTFSR